MSLQPGQPLVDLPSGEARFRLVELLARGENYDIAIGEDLHLDDKRVAIKAIRYRDPTDPAEVQARRAALVDELDVLTLPFSLLPEPLDCLTIANERDFAPGSEAAHTEPLLVFELQHGRTMREAIAPLGEGTIDTRRALRIIHELALFLRGLHAHGRVFRTLSPDHVLLDIDDIIHIVGCGGIHHLEHPVGDVYAERDDPYVAPELRALEPRGGPPDVRGDVYSLGAVLTWLLTGRDPLRVVESPFDDVTFHRLGLRGPGVAKLVARMMQPTPANRFGSMQELLVHLEPDRLPEPGHPDLSWVELPSPWKDPGPGGPKSSLSPGPLVSVPREQAETGADDEPAKPDTPPAERPPEGALAGRYRTIAIALASTAVLSILAVILMALLL